MKLYRFTFGFKAPFLEDFKISSVGRSPDLSSFWAAFPFRLIGTVAMVYVKTLHRTYSSGSVQDLHLIPSSPDMPEGISETNAATKL